MNKKEITIIIIIIVDHHPALQSQQTKRKEFTSKCNIEINYDNYTCSHVDGHDDQDQQ